MLRNEKREPIKILLPCAGITLIRFNGFFSVPAIGRNTPGICACSPKTGRKGAAKIESFLLVVTFEQQLRNTEVCHTGLLRS